MTIVENTIWIGKKLSNKQFKDKVNYSIFSEYFLKIETIIAFQILFLMILAI